MKVSFGISKKKRADGLFMAWVRELPGGKRKYIYDRSRSDLQARLFDLKQKLERGITSSDRSVAEYGEEFLRIHGPEFAASTLLGYRSIFRSRVVPSALGSMKLGDVRHSDVQLLLNSCRSAKSAQNVAGFLRTVFTNAVNDQLLETSPMEGKFRYPQTAKHKYVILSPSEILTLYSSFEGKPEGVPVLLAALCGLRLSECLGLRGESVDLEAGTITVDTAAVGTYAGVDIKLPKTSGSERVIVAPAVVLDALRPFLREGFIFSSDGGITPWNGNNYSRIVRRRIVKLGLPYCRFHDLRHFAATTLMASGLPDKAIADFLGHSNLETTHRYEHILADLKARPAAIFSALFPETVVETVVNPPENERKGP